MNNVTEEPVESILDVDAALKFTGGDRDYLVSIAELFMTEGPKQLQEVAVCVTADDAEGTRKAAHTLKGSVVIFGAKRTATAAQELEIAATSDWARVPKAWDNLNHEMDCLLQAVKELCSS